MSDEKEATQIDVEPQTPPPEGGNTDAAEVPLDSEHSDSAPAREAAKWRKQLREVQAERDQLVERVTALQRQQIDTQVTATGLKPAALWASGAQLSDLVGDDGAPDPEKIRAAVATAKDTLGITDTRPKPARRGLTSGASVPREPVNKWREAFAPPGRRS